MKIIALRVKWNNSSTNVLGSEEYRAGKNMNDVMILEDETIVLIDLVSMVEDLGFRVHSSCNSLDSAFDALETSTPSAALLDINIARQKVWPLAQKLHDNGCKIAFVSADFSHRELSSDFAGIPKVHKPVSPKDIEAVLTPMLAEKERCLAG